MKYILILILMCILFCCNQHKSEPTSELIKVITHYSQSPADSLKLKAAWFLINNMDAHKTLDSKELRVYYTFIDNVFKNETQFFRIDSIYKDYLSKNPYIDLTEYPDKDYIKSEFLIKNIDQAFEFWNKPWTKHLTFEQFCEYILPYRIDDEILEPWRDIFKEKYKNTFTKADFEILSVEQACTKLNIALKDINRQVHFNYTYISGIKPTTMINLKYGTCIDYANLGAYAMRSLGIPVAIDKVPYGHSWNVVITPTGALNFMTSEHNPGLHLKHFKDWKRFPKVYRRTFSINPKCLIFLCGNEEIPYVFRDPCYIDVTNEYFKGADIKVDILNKPFFFLIICIYANLMKNFNMWTGQE